MNQLMQDVEDLLFEGLSYGEIAESLGVSEDEVRATVMRLESMEAETIPVDEWDDAFADADALASAGFGMDEDYGFAHDDY